jgi:hypothetical protein
MNHIQIKEDHTLDPMLKGLINKLSMDKPGWVFSAMTLGDSDTHPYPAHRMEDSPQGKYVRMVRVKEDGQIIGTLAVDRESWGRFRNAGTPHIYIIKSWRIKKQRGSDSTKKTTKLDVAVREAKRNFALKSYREVFDGVHEHMEHNFLQAARGLTGAYERTASHINVGNWATFVHGMLTNTVVPPLLDTEVRNLVLSDKMATHRAEAALGKHMLALNQAKRMRTVAEHEGVFLIPDENETLLPLPFEQLPVSLQERIGVLQLVQDEEIVLDVGFRRSAGQYYVVFDA